MNVPLAIGIGFFWWAGLGFMSSRKALQQDQLNPLLKILPKSRGHALLLLPLVLVLAGSCSLFIFHATSQHQPTSSWVPVLLVLSVTGLISGSCVAIGAQADHSH